MTGTVLSAPGAGELFAELVRRRRLGEVRRELTLVRVPVAGRADARRVGDESRLTRVDRAVPTRGLVVVVVALGTGIGMTLKNSQKVNSHDFQNKVYVKSQSLDFHVTFDYETLVMLIPALEFLVSAVLASLIDSPVSIVNNRLVAMPPPTLT